MQDEFTRKHLEEFQDANGPESQAILQASLVMSAPSIAAVECNHAFIRRVKLSLEMSNTPSVQKASLLYLLAQFRRLLHPPLQGRPRIYERSRRRKKGVSKAALRPKPGWRVRANARRGILRSHGGGAWRIFVSDRMRGHCFQSKQEQCQELKRLPEAYRLLKAADPVAYTKLQRRGRLASVAHRNSLPPEARSTDSKADQGFQEGSHDCPLHGGKGDVVCPAWQCRSCKAPTTIPRIHVVTTRLGALTNFVMPYLTPAEESDYETLWRNEHLLIRQDKAQHLAPPLKSSPCLAAGLCLHQRPQLEHLKARLIARLRETLPAHSHERQQLRSGHIILEVVVRKSKMGPREEKYVGDTFGHVSYISLQSFAITFLVLRRDQSPVQVLGASSWNDETGQGKHILIFIAMPI